MWNTFQTGGRQRWMPQINVMESNAVFLSSPPPYSLVFLPKYTLLCYRWDYINGDRDTPGPHVHTLTIYYETLDRAAHESSWSLWFSHDPGHRGEWTHRSLESCLSQCQEGVVLTSSLFKSGSFCHRPWVELNMATWCAVSIPEWRVTGTAGSWPAHWFLV